MSNWSSLWFKYIKWFFWELEDLTDLLSEKLNMQNLPHKLERVWNKKQKNPRKYSAWKHDQSEKFHRASQNETIKRSDVKNDSPDFRPSLERTRQPLLSWFSERNARTKGVDYTHQPSWLLNRGSWGDVIGGRRPVTRTIDDILEMQEPVTKREAEIAFRRLKNQISWPDQDGFRKCPSCVLQSGTGSIYFKNWGGIFSRWLPAHHGRSNNVEPILSRPDM